MVDEKKPYVTALEAIVGKEIKITFCPKYCDNGWRGMDACNYCGKTGQGFRYRDKFYPNTEEGWRDAIKEAIDGKT